MEPIIILQGISVEQLITQIEKAVEKKIFEKLQAEQTEKPFRYMTRKEVAKFLQVSLPTVNYWRKNGSRNS